MCYIFIWSVCWKSLLNINFDTFSIAAYTDFIMQKDYMWNQHNYFFTHIPGSNSDYSSCICDTLYEEKNILRRKVNLPQVWFDHKCIVLGWFAVVYKECRAVCQPETGKKSLGKYNIQLLLARNILNILLLCLIWHLTSFIHIIWQHLFTL